MTGAFGAVLVAVVVVAFGYTLGTFAIDVVNQASHEAPVAEFDFGYGGDRITVTHSTGDVVQAEKLVVEVDDATGGNATFEWANASAGAVRSGDSVVVGVENTSAEFTVPFAFDPGDRVRVVWKDSSGSVVLGEFEVPASASG